jgi:hypothetical protein
MVDYPTDLDLNENKDIHLDASNDLELTSGIEQLQQSVAVDVLDEIQALLSGRVSGENIGLLEERIASGLNDDPQVGDVRSVTIESFNRQTDEVAIDVKLVRNEDFTLEVST